MGQAQRDSESLAIYEALVQAMERRRDVFEVVESSSDTDAAVAEVQELLGISELLARAVLDTQLRRYTERDRQRIIEARDRLRASVESSEQP